MSYLYRVVFFFFDCGNKSRLCVRIVYKIYEIIGMMIFAQLLQDIQRKNFDIALFFDNFDRKLNEFIQT